MCLVAWRTKVNFLYIDLQMVKEPQATIQMPQVATNPKFSSILHFFKLSNRVALYRFALCDDKEPQETT